MKNIKSLFILVFASLFSFNTNAQLTVSSIGSVSINANTSDWGSGLKVTVPTQNSCAYHLTYAGHDRFYVCANGWLWTERGGYFGSDIKLKQNINKIISPLSTVLKLNGIQFTYIGDETVPVKNGVQNNQRLGFVAQEVDKILPGIVKIMPDSTLAIAYTDLTALLVEAIKEQQAQIDLLKKKINEKNINSSEKSSNTDESINDRQMETYAYLSQNVPNPFNQTTVIDFYLPENTQKAALYIYDMNGSQVKNYPVFQKGQGSITIRGSELKPGMYFYTLLADGAEVDTKRMILTK